VAVPESPPAPTFAALGPTRGGGKGPSPGVGPDTGGAITPGVCAPTPGVASDAGGTSPDGDPPGKPVKNSLAMRDTSPTIAAKSKAEAPVEPVTGSTEGAPPRRSLVLMIVADIDVFEHCDGVVREHCGRAIQRNQVRGGAAIVDAHPANGQARAHFTRDTRLK